MSSMTRIWPSQAARRRCRWSGWGRLGDLARQRLGHRLEHDGKGAGLGHGRGIVLDRPPTRSRLRPWVLKPPNMLIDWGVRPIWAITGMPRSVEKANGLGHARAAFDLDGAALGFLDHLRAALWKACGRALLIGAEGHVDHHQRLLGAAHHRRPMHDHQVEGNRQGGLEAMHDHAERIADQKEIDIAVGDSGGMGMVGGERDDRLAALAGADLGGVVTRAMIYERTSAITHFSGEASAPARR